MSRAIHSKAQAQAWLDGLSEKVLEQGFIPYFPKLELAYRTKHPRKRFSRTCDEDIRIRLDRAWDRWMSLIPKGQALDMMCALWEKPTDEQIKEWANAD